MKDSIDRLKSHLLKGDYSKGKKILGWQPTVSFKELVQMMVDADLKYLRT